MIELVIYGVLSLMLLGAIYLFFFRGSSAYTATSETYLLGKEAEAGMRYLRADLQETALSSIRVFPNTDNSSEAAGLSLASARDYDEDQFTVNDYGAPDWSKHIFYTLEKEDDNRHRLVRWSQKMSSANRLPIPAVDLPGSKKDTTKSRVVIKGLAAPNLKLDGDDQPLGAEGGFRVAFVRNDEDGEIQSDRPGESLTTWNPAQVSAGEAGGLKIDGNTKVVEVTLVLLVGDARQGSQSYIRFPFRVSPRH